MEAIEISRPDDWHLHLRDGEVLADLVPHTARVFGRALVMPNLRPPVETVAQALAYHGRIVAAVPRSGDFEPFMTLYLTPRTTTREVEKAAACPQVLGIKLYPAGATTNADAGVSDLSESVEVFRAMESLGLPLLIHGESIESGVDVFDREAVFVREQLGRLIEEFPRLRVVLEHVTCAEAVEFVASAPDQVAATITAHHLLYDRNAMFAGGLRPHLYCLPVLKRARHRQALLKAATSGSPKFFLGTDSAPHPVTAKETSCGCAGIFTAHAALEFYAEAFAQVGALDRLEGFASRFGAEFYGLSPATTKIRLLPEPRVIPMTYSMGDASLVPLRAGQTLQWRIDDGASAMAQDASPTG